jgi:putative membrane protein
MLFIDFLTLMLINMAAGLVLLACYLVKGLDDPDQPRWAPAFGIVGLIALLNGFRIAWLWPLPGSYNVAFGDTTVLLGALFVAAAVSLARGRNLLPLAIYAFFAGLAGLLVGVRVLVFGMTAKPLLSAVGFILTGFAGVMVGPTLWLRQNKTVRYAGAAVLLAAAAIWALTGYAGYWVHLGMFSKWVAK